MNQNYSKLLIFISVLDIIEYEIGFDHRLIHVLQETIHFIFHFLLSTSYKFFLDELLAILKLREKNDGIKLAMVIMYARASKNDEIESIRKSINYLKKIN